MNSLDKYIELLSNMCSCIAPSGYEALVRNKIISAIRNEGYQIHQDKMGNLIIYIKGKKTKPRKIAFLAHMDSAAVIVTGESNGVYYAGSLSKWKREKIDNSDFSFLSGKQAKVSFIGEMKDRLVLNDVKGQNFEIGDVGVLKPDFYYDGKIVKGTFLDDRIGCVCLIRMILELESVDDDIYFVFTAQEEIGNKGARSIKKAFDFDEAIVVDTTVCKEDEQQNAVFIAAGEGAACKMCDGAGICSDRLYNSFMKLAERRNVRYQKEILTYAGSDIAAFSEDGCNCEYGAVSIPCKYMHSPREEINIYDAKATYMLLKYYLEEISNAKFSC